MVTTIGKPRAKFYLIICPHEGVDYAHLPGYAQVDVLFICLCTWRACNYSIAFSHVLSYKYHSQNYGLLRAQLSVSFSKEILVEPAKVLDSQNSRTNRIHIPLHLNNVKKLYSLESQIMKDMKTLWTSLNTPILSQRYTQTVYGAIGWRWAHTSPLFTASLIPGILLLIVTIVIVITFRMASEKLRCWTCWNWASVFVPMSLSYWWT